MKNKVLSVLCYCLFMLACMVLITTSAAHASDKEEIVMLEKSKISLTEAIAIAEKHVSGKALSAEIEDDSFEPTFSVSVTKDHKVFDVMVDGLKGTVQSVREDID